MIPDNVLKAKNQAWDELLGSDPLRNVVGIGVGSKRESRDDAWTVRFYVQSLRSADRMPAEVHGIPTEIIEAGSFRPLAGPMTAAEVVRPGSSIGHGLNASNVNRSATGTLGAILRDQTRRWYALTNNHVLAINGRVPLGSPILCPRSRNPFAALAGFVPFRRDAGNLVDAAVALVTDRACVDPAFPKEVGRLAEGLPPKSLINRTVLKVGQATGVTYGAVTDVSADFLLDYSFGTFRFERQILIQRPDGEFADEGDSGSLVVDLQTRKPIALMFSQARGYTAASPIGEVLSQLGNQLNRRFSFEQPREARN